MSMLDTDSPSLAYVGARPLADGYPRPLPEGYSYEVDERGDHRLVRSDGAPGPWAGYAQPALSAAGTRAVFSQFWEGTFPTEKLVRVEEVA